MRGQFVRAWSPGIAGRPGAPCAQRRAGETSLGELLVALATGYEIGTRAGEAVAYSGRVARRRELAFSRRLRPPSRGSPRGLQHIQPAIEAAACQIPASLYLPIAEGSVLRNTYPAHAVLLGICRPPRPPQVSRCRGARWTRAGAGFCAQPSRRPRRRRANGRFSTAISSLSLACVTRITALRRRCGSASVMISHWRRSGRSGSEIYPEAVQYCGNRAPRTAIQAQFSLSYAIAAALVLGDLGPNAYTDLTDPTIRHLERHRRHRDRARSCPARRDAYHRYRRPAVRRERRRCCRRPGNADDEGSGRGKVSPL